MPLLIYWTAACEDLHAVRAGRTWYRAARLECQRLAAAHGLSERTVAGMVAALSPRMPWDDNVAAAARLLAGGRARALGANVRKAERIRAGESPDDVLRGPKVRSFYRAILGDESAVVLDTWMLRALGHPKDTVTDRQYRRLARHVAEVARMVACTPAQFQATVWVHIRGRA